jgi:hypothetical protein
MNASAFADLPYPFAAVVPRALAQENAARHLLPSIASFREAIIWAIRFKEARSDERERKSPLAPMAASLQ